MTIIQVEKGVEDVMNTADLTLEQRRYLFSNRDLLALIIPLVIEQLLSILVGMADTVMVSSVGEAAVSGVSLVDNVMVLLINIFAALATGGAVIAGQYLGQNNIKQARNAVNQLMWFTGVLAAGIMLLAYGFRTWVISTLFGQISQDVWYYANSYYLIVAASIPFIALYNAGAAIFRTMGNSRVTMKISMIMNAINVVGNAIFIYVFNMEAAGAALATLIARMVAAIIVIILLLDHDLPLRLAKTLRHRFDGQMIKRVMSIGIPNGLENGLFQLGKILLLSLISRFGTASITANAVMNTVTAFQVLPGSAIALGITTVISRCVGAGDYKQARYYNRKLLGIAYAAMWLVSLVILALLSPILRLYQLSAETMAIARKLGITYTIMAMTLWPLSFALPSTLRAAGDARFTMGVSIFSMWAFRLVLGYVLGLRFNLGVFGVWLAMYVDWLFRGSLFGWRYLNGAWESKRAI